MPAGSRRSIGAPRWRRSTAPMTRASGSMSGSTKPGRATSAPASPPGNWVSTACRDVANKIGTYLKALAAHDNGVPFYVALPSPTIDWEIEDGAAIPIETRDPREVTHIAGWTEAGERVEVRLTPEGSPAANFAFDVTPARLVTALITERGAA